MRPCCASQPFAPHDPGCASNQPVAGRTLSLPEGLTDYLAARDQQRQERVEQQWSALSKREQRLVREAAVMGYVNGFRASPYRKDIPPDSTIVTEVLSAADAFSDLYPTLHRAGRRKAKR